MDIQLTAPGREQSRARYPDSSGYIKRDGLPSTPTGSPAPRSSARPYRSPRR